MRARHAAGSERLMEFLHNINPLYSLSGLLIGVLVGFVGVGGGSLMTPLLVLLFGVHPATAVGTDLLYAGLTKIGGTAVHARNDAVDWRITRRLAAGSAPAAALTLIGLSWFGRDSQAMSQVITTTLGVSLIITAVALIFRAWLLARVAKAIDALSDRQIRLLTNLLGGALGVLVSISSVGAGAIGVTVLLMLYPRLPTVKIVGSDIAHAVPLTLIAGAGHWWTGAVDWALLASLLIGSLPGIALGSQMASRVPEGVLRPVLAGTLAVVGVMVAI